jgi:nitrite reductase/ring-hydroxylating ferredoxin subunit
LTSSSAPVAPSGGLEDPHDPLAGTAPPTAWEPGFNEYLLGAVVALTVFTIVFAITLFLQPADYLQIEELQPAARVADEANFPVGASRVVTWGTEAILVIHSGPGDYHAVQGTSTLEGCTLEWDAAALRIVSPCNFLVYDLHGNVVRGLTTVPLHRYTVFVRQGMVYVTGRYRE